MFELIIIVIVSFFSYLKKRLPLVLIGIAAIILLIFLFRNAGGTKQSGEGGAETNASVENSIVETNDITANDKAKSDASTKEDGSDKTDSSASSDDSSKSEASSQIAGSDKTDTSASSDKDTLADAGSASQPGTTESDNEQKKSDDIVQSEPSAADTAASKPGESSSKDNKTSHTLTNSPAKELPGDIDIVSFTDEYPETAAWLWFEDGTVSYPVMQTSDNTRYKSVDYTGAEARTGSIFLDSRSSSSFTDPNTIIYGHNMSDGTMFGIFKKYKYDRTYLKGHEYFQIITKDSTQRYRIFAYMDLPKNSELYNICGPDTDKMKTLTDYLEHRTYIDSGIEAKPDDQLVMLSTCTDKDDLYFVVVGMRIDY